MSVRKTRGEPRAAEPTPASGQLSPAPQHQLLALQRTAGTAAAAESVLALQRTAGNAAVVKALQLAGHSPGGEGSGQCNVIKGELGTVFVYDTP